MNKASKIRELPPRVEDVARSTEDKREAAQLQSSAEERMRQLALDNDDLRFEAIRLRASLAQKHAEMAALATLNDELRLQLERVYRSASWSMTQPLRAAVDGFRRKLGRSG